MIRAPALALALLVAPACLVDNPVWDGQGAGDDTSVTSTAGATGDTADPSDASGSDASASDTGEPPLPAGCEREPTAELTLEIDPSQAAQLDEIAASAAPGTALLLADGVYDRAGQPAIELAAPGLQLRSRSGDPESVVIDGGGDSAALVHVRDADVLLAEITLRGAVNLVRIRPGPDDPVARPRLHRVHLQDPSEFALAIDADFAAGVYADDGVVSCSVFSLHDEHRVALPDCISTAAIKAHATAGWIVRDNAFLDFWCPDSTAFVAVHFTSGARDTVVERNVFRDAYRALMFGFEATPEEFVRPAPEGDCPDTSLHFGGRIVNNMLWVGGADLAAASAGVDSMISVWSACGVDLQFNTAVNLLPVFSSIEYRFLDTTGTIANNLLSGSILARDAAAVVLAGNVEGAGLESFVDPGAGDVHLRPSASVAIDAGVDIGAGPPADDFDAEPRDSMPDVGADELSASG